MKEPLSPELQDLHAYVDRQLPPHARQRVEEHRIPGYHDDREVRADSNVYEVWQRTDGR